MDTKCAVVFLLVFALFTIGSGDPEHSTGPIVYTRDQLIVITQWCYLERDLMFFAN